MVNLHKKPSRLLRCCVGTIFIIMGIRVLWKTFVFHGGMTAATIVSLLLFILAYGLFNDHRWALRSSAVMVWIIAIILPVGIFSPFRAGDYMAAGIQPPDVTHTLLWLIPIEIILLAVGFVLDPKKDKLASKAQKHDLSEIMKTTRSAN
jgi:hypothetical protein